jgi:hypothetical protein
VKNEGKFWSFSAKRAIFFLSGGKKSTQFVHTFNNVMLTWSVCCCQGRIVALDCVPALAGMFDVSADDGTD